MTTPKDAPVIRIARMRALPGKRAELLEAARGNVQDAASQPGCRSAEVCADSATNDGILVISRWESLAALQAFLAWHETIAHASLADFSDGKPQATQYPVLAVGRMAERAVKGVIWAARRDGQVPEDVARLLTTVPEWFGRAESNAEYVEAARAKETWTVRDSDGAVVGVTLVDRHYPHLAEIHLIVVDRAAHGSGVGSAMIAAIEADAIERGVRLLEVKTLGASDPHPGYARTRHFYEGRGFLPLEETDLWGADTPCLIMIKPLGSTGR